LILCEYLVGRRDGTDPVIILDGKAGFIGDDLVIGRVNLITRVRRNDLILELCEEGDDQQMPIEWLRLVELPEQLAELLAGGSVIRVIDGNREIGIANPVRGIELDNGEVEYA
jgi:hypothetical protein